MRKNEIKKKNISANALSDDDLEDVAGGRTFPTPTTVVLTTPDGKEYVAEYPTPEAAKKAKLELLKQGYTDPFAIQPRPSIPNKRRW